MKNQSIQNLSEAADAMFEIIMTVEVCDEQSAKVVELANEAHRKIQTAFNLELGK